jgi:glutamyl-tRNA synthetase
MTQSQIPPQSTSGAYVSKVLKPLPLKSSLASNPTVKEPLFKRPGSPFLVEPKALRSLLAIMNMHAAVGGAACHYGGPSAFAEIVSALYGLIFHEALEKKKNWYDLYHIINDAGHCENIHYAVKACYQFAGLKISDLWKFRSIDSPLSGHGESHLFPQGVLLSNGPLGSAFPQSQGLSLGDALQGSSRVTITLISDGALMEGEAKEALAAIPGFASRRSTAPYVLIISDNNTKLSGRIDEDSFSLQPTLESLSVLGWQVEFLEQGHDLDKCYQALTQSIQKAQAHPEKPVVLWVKTIKGYGHKAWERSPSGGHGFSLTVADQLPSFLEELWAPQAVPEEFQRWCKDLTQKAPQVQKAPQKESQPAGFVESTGSGESTNSSAPVVFAKIQEGVSKALIQAAQEGLPVISVTSDLPGSTGVLKFRKEFPTHSLDVGISESNMISTASGLAKVGYIPVVDTFAQFGVTKGALPLLMSSLSQAPVIGFFSHIGFQDAADGASHQSLNYLAFTLGLPSVEVWSLSSAEEAESLVGQAVREYYECVLAGKTPPSYLFFLGRESFPVSYQFLRKTSPSLKSQNDSSLQERHLYPQGSDSSKTGKSSLSNGDDFGNRCDQAKKYSFRSHRHDYQGGVSAQVLLIVMGSLIPEALEAAKQLEKESIFVDIIHPGYLTHPDLKMLSVLLKKVEGRVVFVEDHQKVGGFAQHWISVFVQNRLPVVPEVLGVSGVFGRSAYTAQELYQHYGVSSSHIKDAVKKQLTRKVRVRFAPSPTGYLHVGGARTALYNFIFAKKMQGTFVLRVEDTDLARSTEESLRMVMEDLQWLGLTWDEGPDPVTLKDRGDKGPYRQSQRLDLYQSYAQKLLDEGLAYYCFLTDEELEAQRQKKLSQGLPPHVESPYRDWSLSQALEKKQRGAQGVIRFKTQSVTRSYTFKDLIRGEVTFPSDMVGDFVLLRSDGMPVYNFCNAIDDYLMDISHVLRAEEHLPNTLRQLMIYEAFGWSPPEFGHLSLILDEDRKKLSKRKGATSCHEFKLEGYLPEALNNFVALLGWSHPEGKEIVTLDEIIEHFDLDRLNPAGAIFDPVKLKWMNSQYLRALSSQEIIALLKSLLPVTTSVLPETLVKAVEVFKSGFETLEDVAKALKVLDDDSFTLNEEAGEVLSWEATRPLLEGWKSQIESFPRDFLTEEDFLNIQESLKNTIKVKGKHLFMPLRVAVLGKPHGAELKQIVPLLGKDQLLYRVKKIEELYK